MGWSSVSLWGLESGWGCGLEVSGTFLVYLSLSLSLWGPWEAGNFPRTVDPPFLCLSERGKDSCPRPNQWKSTVYSDPSAGKGKREGITTEVSFVAYLQVLISHSSLGVLRPANLLPGCWKNTRKFNSANMWSHSVWTSWGPWLCPSSCPLPGTAVKHLSQFCIWTLA